MEEWISIPGFSRYEASTDGRLRSLSYKNTMRCRVIKPTNDQGYLKTMLLGDDGKYHTSRVHRWVAAAFFGPPNGREINHKNGTKTDNRISNLEYCTRSQNIQHAYDNGLQVPKKGEQVTGHKLTEEAVVEIRTRAKNGGRFWGRKELAKKYGVSESTVKDIVNQRRGAWKHVICD